MSWREWKKKSLFWSVVFTYSVQQWRTISLSDCDVRRKVDFIQPAQWLDWEEAPKHFPKLNLHGKRVMVTIWWSAAHLIHYSFLNANKTIASEKCAQQIDENRKLQHLQPALVNRKGPSASSPDLSPADYHSFTHLDNFLQGRMLPQPAGGRKCFPRVHWIWSMDFYTTEINSHIFSHGQKCVDFNG